MFRISIKRALKKRPRITGAQERYDHVFYQTRKDKVRSGEEDRSREGYVRVYFCPVCSRNHPF